MSCLTSYNYLKQSLTCGYLCCVQPAIDAYTLALMRTFNRLSPSSTSSSKLNFRKLVGGLKGSERENVDNVGRVQPLVYATYQAYLRR